MSRLADMLANRGQSTWDETYVDNITFLRTYRLLVNKFAHGEHKDVYEPQMESMDVPMALWTSAIACMVAMMRDSALAGVYTMLIVYVLQQIAFFLMLSNGRLRIGSPAVGYTFFPAIISLFLGCAVIYLVMTTGPAGDAHETTATSVAMGTMVALGACYMSWVSTTTGGVTANYATAVRGVLFGAGRSVQ
jgi:hypothetical protein